MADRLLGGEIIGRKPHKPCGFLSFMAWSLQFNMTPLPEGEGEEAEAEATNRGELEILPEAGASMVEALGGPAEADCSGGPLLVGAAQVEAPLWVHSKWQYSGW